MIIEAGFGLCAVNLPFLYGMVRIKGVRTLMNSIQSFFSLRSISRNSPHGSSNKRRRTGSEDSGRPVIRRTNEPKQSSSDIEFTAVEHDERIQVTKTFEIADNMA